MSVSPATYVLKNNNVASLLARSDKETIELAVRELYEAFLKGLEKTNSSTSYKITASSKPFQYKFSQDKEDHYLNDFAKLAIEINSQSNDGVKEKELITLYFEVKKDYVVFTVHPVSTCRGFDTSASGKSAEIKTEALKSIVETFFKVSQSQVAYTSTDQDIPDYRFHRFKEKLSESTLSLISKDLLPEDKMRALIKELKEAVYEVEERDGYFLISTTNQPYSLSSYNDGDVGHNTPALTAKSIFTKHLPINQI